MMTLDIVIMVVAVCWFFWLASREHDATGAPTTPPQGRVRAGAAAGGPAGGSSERAGSDPPTRERAAI
jgi:hypothetical protein